MIIFSILFTLLISLLAIAIFWAINMYIKSKSSRPAESIVSELIAQKADLSRWRGGVRYPAGYYKSKTDFYKSEKKLHYSK